MNIFVAKLNFKTTTEGLQDAFAAFGTVDKASVIMDRETGRSKGFGFVEMNIDDEARAAIAALNETQLDGSTIVVKEALPREDMPRRPFGGGGSGGGGGFREKRDFGGGGGGGFREKRDFGGGGGGYRDKNSGGGGGNRWDD